MQSVTPALPKLLPNVVVELPAKSKQCAVGNGNLPADMSESAKNRGREQCKGNNHCEYIRPTSVVSSQTFASNSTCEDDLCCKDATLDMSRLSSELLTKSCVDDSTISNGISDQISIASAELDAAISDKHGSCSAAENNVDCSCSVAVAQPPPCDTEQNISSPDNEASQCSETDSQPVVKCPPGEVRTFTAAISDSPDIIFSSSRKKNKSAKPGIYILNYIYCTFALHIRRYCSFVLVRFSTVVW